MTIIIDGQRAIGLLRDVVRGREDYIDPYSGGSVCQYVRNGAPSCIAGHAMVAAGAPLAAVAIMDGLGDMTEISGALQIVAEGRGETEPLYNLYEEAVQLAEEIEMDGPAAEVLGAAQLSQDDGSTWGRALAEAEHTWYVIQNDES
jgi:hypothetical protein